MAEHTDLPVELVDLARRVESEAQIADRPGQLARLEAIANRLRDLSGYAETAEILADPNMVAAIREGEEALSRGDVVGLDELVAALSSGGAATPDEWTPRLDAIVAIRAIGAACDDAYPGSASADVDTRKALHVLGVTDDEIAIAEAGPRVLASRSPREETDHA